MGIHVRASVLMPRTTNLSPQRPGASPDASSTKYGRCRARIRFSTSRACETDDVEAARTPFTTHTAADTMLTHAHSDGQEEGSEQAPARSARHCQAHTDSARPSREYAHPCATCSQPRRMQRPLRHRIRRCCRPRSTRGSTQAHLSECAVVYLSRYQQMSVCEWETIHSVTYVLYHTKVFIRV